MTERTSWRLFPWRRRPHVFGANAPPRLRITVGPLTLRAGMPWHCAVFAPFFFFLRQPDALNRRKHLKNATIIPPAATRLFAAKTKKNLCILNVAVFFCPGSEGSWWPLLARIVLGMAVPRIFCGRWA